MKRIFYFLIFLLPLLLMCIEGNKGKDTVVGNLIDIDIKSLQMVDLKVGNLRYIPLETSDDCLIGSASKVLIRNEKIYVADFSRAMALFVFDMNGKFLFKVARRGQGPREYVSFRDFDIHNNGEIYMFDIMTRKFIIVDSEGKYQRELILDYNVNNFCLVDDKIYLSRLRGTDGKTYADLAVYDIKNGKTTSLLDDEKFLYDIPMHYSAYSFFYSPHNIYYSPKLSEIIYSINKDGINSAIGIKNLPLPPKQAIDKWVNEKNPMNLAKMLKDDNYFIVNLNIHETDDYISFQYLIGTSFNNGHILYNKKKKTAYSLKGYNVYIGAPLINGSTGKEFFSVMTFVSDIRDQAQKKIRASHEELKNWQEEDNPVIAIFDLDMDSPKPFDIKEHAKRFIDL